MLDGPDIVRIHALHVHPAVQGHAATTRGLARSQVHARRHVPCHVLHIHGIFPGGEAELLLGLLLGQPLHPGLDPPSGGGFRRKERF